MSDLVKDAYLQPESSLGIHLTSLAEWKVPGVLIHECGFQKQMRNWNYPNVLSPFWRLYYNSRPGNYVRWKKRRIDLTPQRLLLIPDHCLFDCCGPRQPPHLWIHFSLTPSHSFDCTSPLEIKLNPALRLLLQEIRRLCSRRQSTKIMRTIAHHAAAVLHATLAQCPPPLSKPLPSRIQNILKLIQTASTLEYSNQSLARQAGMRAETFRRCFKHHIGCTAMQYIQKNRIHQACRDLAFTDQSIEQIAEKTGFPNRHYFTRIFTKVMRQSPAIFRKIQRQI